MQAPQTPLAGHYRFSRSLQTGAKSVSWLAIDENTRRTVIASALGAARVAGLEGIVGVRHPHLAAVVDVIHDADPASLPEQAGALKSAAIAVAEYVHGVTLHERLRSNRLDLAEAVQIVDRLAEAVESLHAIGGVHGAISPRSVVVDPDNGPAGPVLTQLVVPPSGSYCSPERLRGHGPSTVDDMWALHATLYATLTGTTPFSGTSREQLVRSMVSTGVAPLSEHGIDDAKLQQIVTRGLASEPAKRCTDVVELREALHAWQDSRVSTAPQPSPGPAPIQPHEEDEAEWDDDNARTIVSSAAELLAAARAATAAADARRLPPVEDDEDDEAPTSIVDVAALGFPLPPSASPVSPPRQSAPGPARRQSAPGPLPPPRPAPHVPPPPVSSPGASAYAEDDEDDEDAATRILDSEEMLGMAADSVRTERPPGADLREEPPLPAFPVAQSSPPDFPGAAAVPPGAMAAAPGQMQVAPPPMPPPVSPQDATVLGPGAKTRSRKGAGVVVWALLTLIIACGVTAYLLRRRLIPILASYGLVSAPGTATPATPRGGSKAPTPAALPTADGGSNAAASNDAGTAGTAGTAAAKQRPKEVGACVASYFRSDTFHSTKGFGFLCKDHDFRDITTQLYKRIVLAGGGKVTPGMKEWSRLHWYELPATAVIRHGCCPPDTKPIQLPKEGGDKCDQLADTLTKMVATPLAPADVSSRADQFAKTLHCMFERGVPRPFHYGRLPHSSNRAAFEDFWRRAATQYGG